jgi:hypothetical protein
MTDTCNIWWGEFHEFYCEALGPHPNPIDPIHDAAWRLAGGAMETWELAPVELALVSGFDRDRYGGKFVRAFDHACLAYRCALCGSWVRTKVI